MGLLRKTKPVPVSDIPKKPLPKYRIVVESYASECRPRYRVWVEKDCWSCWSRKTEIKSGYETEDDAHEAGLQLLEEYRCIDEIESQPRRMYYI